MAKSLTPEPEDRDRLFVRRIIDERARGLFGDNLQEIIDMPSENRWRIVFPEHDDEDDDAPAVPPDVREVILSIMSEVEAWVVVEQARQGSKVGRK